MGRARPGQADAPVKNARKLASCDAHMLWIACIGGVRGIESGVVGWYISGGELACEVSNASLRSGGVCHGCQRVACRNAM
jgi:hypothetical protein